MRVDKVWIIQKAEHSEDLSCILLFLLEEFIRIFGEDTMTSEECIVYNDIYATSPMLILNEFPVKIRLAQEGGLSFWAQTIFQLSHELCHYAIRQKKSDKNFTLKWFEELVCESMSLYALFYSSERWSKCPLSKRNKKFSSSIKKYLLKELDKESKGKRLNEIPSLEELVKYENFSESNRETRYTERREIYVQGLRRDPKNARFFLEYPKYLMVSSCLMIDFNRWKKDTQNPFISLLEFFHPKIYLK